MFDALDRKFMKKAILLAKKGLGAASPNPSVGCVIVKDGRVLGRGWHEYASLDHAEVRALHEAGIEARDATVYVTLEPCCHQGRTPPCVNALIAAGVGRVVIACTDPNPIVSGRGAERLRSAGIHVDMGLMAEEAKKIIEAFACYVTTHRPLVVCKAGMSLDGKIGTGSPEGIRISSPEGIEFGQGLRLQSDALLVGVNTVLSDDPELTYRGNFPKSRPLIKVILDSGLRTPPSARLFRGIPPSPVLIFCSSEASSVRRLALEKAGAEVITVPCHEADGLDIPTILQELGHRKVLSLLVEGGSRVHWSFIEGNYADLFVFIIAPVVLGGIHAIPAVGGKGYVATAEAPRFRIRKTHRVGSDMVVEAYPSYSRSIVSPWAGRQ
jgi:diaminohydroxyphosphoribosylaminopyrimidine deaminase/5-amino-6-(5-phosphoribosylamino)uracil reductase